MEEQTPVAAPPKRPRRSKPKRTEIRVTRGMVATARAIVDLEISQYAAAQRSKMDLSHLRRILRGERTPQTDTMERLREGLDVQAQLWLELATDEERTTWTELLGTLERRGLAGRGVS